MRWRLHREGIFLKCSMASLAARLSHGCASLRSEATSRCLRSMSVLPPAAFPPATPAPGDPAPIDVTFGDVSMAMFRIRSGIHRTETHHSIKMSRLLDSQVFFKAEFSHPTGSFKERGARNALLQLGEAPPSADMLPQSPNAGRAVQRSVQGPRSDRGV